MTKHVLFVHGAGLGAYEEDGKLAEYLREALGNSYTLRYPNMPDEDEPRYEAWKAQIAHELATFDGPALLVGHSFGGSILLKYLSEEQVETPIAGLFLLAPPFVNYDSDWRADEFALREDFAARLATIPRIFVYHSHDDAIVPFAHMVLYAEKLPQATVRTFADRGHQFQNDLHEVAKDILAGSRSAT